MSVPRTNNKWNSWKDYVLVEGHETIEAINVPQVTKFVVWNKRIIKWVFSY